MAQHFATGLRLLIGLALVLPGPVLAQVGSTAVRCAQRDGRAIVTSLAWCREAGGVLLGGPPGAGWRSEPPRPAVPLSPPPPPAAAAQAPPPAVPPVAPQAIAVQTLLKALGYDVDPVDGAPGPRTREAVRQFQRSEGLPMTGEADGALMQRLLAAVRHRRPPGAEEQATIAGLEGQVRRAREENRELVDLVNRVLDSIDFSR